MIHKIKLREEFAEAVLREEKNFEVRENDRGYQKGDLVCFITVDKSGIEKVINPLENITFEITYVLNGWGIKEGFVVFGIKKCGTILKD